MKYILTLLVLITFISCNDYHSKETEDKKVEKRKIDPILESMYPPGQPHLGFKSNER